MDLETFGAYPRESRKTWNVITMDHLIVYPALGPASEAGEVAGTIKRSFGVAESFSSCWNSQSKKA